MLCFNVTLFFIFLFQVSLVLSALQAGNKGTQACITAASAVSGIIADLDTTIMFATAGTLNAENNESFADHRSVIPKKLVEGAGCNKGAGAIDKCPANGKQERVEMQFFLPFQTPNNEAR